MAAAPRIAMLAQNVFERDPRVYRAAQAARRAGYRAVALGPGCQGPHGPRWGEEVDGVPVYESGPDRRTLLSRVRTLTAGYLARRQRAAPATPEGHATEGGSVRARTGLVQSARDLAVVALLIRNNIDYYQRFRGLGARVVHANDLNVLLCGYLLARRWGALLIYDSHELWAELDEGASPLRRRLIRFLEGWLIRRADGVITVNSALAAELATMYGIPLPAVVMNCPALPDGEPDAAATAALPPPPEREPGRIAAIYQGTVHYQAPHLEHMLDDLATVQEVTFTLRGRGTLPKRLRQRLADLDAPNIQVVPPVPMQVVLAALGGYDVGLIPYQPVNKHFRLCSPNKLFDYMMAGLAVICSDIPVVREVVTRADCGLLYDPSKPGALAAALRRLARDPQLLARYKGNARRAAMEWYNAGVEEAKLIALYRELVGAVTPDAVAIA